jgi:ribosome biogenesis GTPase A
MLWPKFEDPKTGLKLAFCGSVRDEILDMSALALELIAVLRADYPRLLAERYKLTDEEIGAENPLSVMDAIAARRGFLRAGGRADYERAGRALLDEFRAGRIGRITLEKPPLGFAANAGKGHETKGR